MVLFKTFIFIYKIKYIIYSVFEAKNIVHNIFLKRKNVRIGKGVKDTQIHIDKNLWWFVLTKILFLLVIIMDPFMMRILVSENSTGIRNGDCNPRNGWGWQFGPKSAGLLKVEAAWPCWSLLLKSLPLLHYQVECSLPRVLVFAGAMDSSWSQQKNLTTGLQRPMFGRLNS